MYQFWNISALGYFTWLSVIIQSYHSLPNVKMEVTLNANLMTLSCFVSNRDSRKNIYLLCPLVSDQFNCLENCIVPCHDDDCHVGESITCKDKGFDHNTNVYRIDYIINGNKLSNNGKWSCQYGGESSSVIQVNVSSEKTIPPKTIKFTTTFPQEDLKKPFIETNQASKQVPKKEIINTKKPKATESEDRVAVIHYDKLLTKLEFIITVVGLLALSLLLNIFFCCRMLIIHCKSKKKTTSSRQYLSMNQNPPYNRSNSQVSDPDRIYEDTSTNPRYMSFLSQIKNGNGNYLAPSTLSPTSGLSTMLPHIPFNQSISFPSSYGDNGSQQLNYPFLGDQLQAPSNFPTENNYTNFVSVQPEMCLRDGSNNPQPVYLAFQSGHPVLTAGNRYVHYSNQPLQSVASISKENRLTSKNQEISSSNLSQSSNNTSQSLPENGKTNYQLSREMMEEADSLLRTADILLKSTENEIQFYQQ